MIISSREQIDNKKILVMTSIGGSPIHEGHTRVIRACKSTAQEAIDKSLGQSFLDRMPPRYFTGFEAKLLVVVNCDDFLIRKHGYVFQNENSRAEILDAIKDVDYTYIHYSDKQTIDDAIHYFQPHYFCKGGDRSDISCLPKEEVEACNDYGTVILFGVGGTDKITSSTTLINNIASLINDRNKGWDNLGPNFK